MRRRGDNGGAGTWLRIIVAIGEPPTEARHLANLRFGASPLAIQDLLVGGRRRLAH